MSKQTRLERFRKRISAKREARNQQYSRPMDDIELKNRLDYMMSDPDPTAKLAFKEAFPEKYPMLELAYENHKARTESGMG
jgi:dephospho-CoA kinase